MLELQLVTLLGEKLKTSAYEVIIPTEKGDIAVFPDHETLVTLAISGVVAVRNKKDDEDDWLEYYAISGGIVEIANNVVRILVDEADSSDEVVESEAQEALKLAQKMKQEAKNPVELTEAQALVNRHATRLKLADLKRRKRKY